MANKNKNTEPIKNERGVFNTTIDIEILDNFKNYCKQIGMPMNMIVETFMDQFVNGDFILKIAKGNKVKVDIEEDY